MDMKQQLTLAVFVIAAIAIIASFFNMLTRERRQRVGYTYSGGGDVDWNSNPSSSNWDAGSSSGSHGGHHCSDGGSSGSDGGSCGGGDGGGGGGGN